MAELNRLLEDPAVEIVDSAAEFGADQAERVREGYNRAAGGIIEDQDGRILFMRRGSGWRLPGTDVGQVEAFEADLRTALRDRVGIESSTVEPTRIHRHAATNYEDVPDYHYVLFDVVPTEPQVSALGESPDPNTELNWFAHEPSNPINDGVVERLFRERATG
jgi:ADP-ribose pyrophosphatase YjhB (NUDIX family)